MGKSIESIGLSQFTGGPGEVANLARIDDDHGQVRGSLKRDNEMFHAATGFDHKAGGIELLEGLNQTDNFGRVIADDEVCAGFMNGDVEFVFGNIDADVGGLISWTDLLGRVFGFRCFAHPGLRMRAQGPRQLSGLGKEQV